MKARELINLFRNEVDDTVEPYRWSDPEAIEYLNDASNEAARRARLLLDSTTEEITRIAVTAETHTYDLDPRVIFVRKARFAGSMPLRRMNMQDMESHDPMWEDASSSEPTVFVPDFGTGQIRLWPTPDFDDTLVMTVVRLPLADINDLEDDIEINARYQRSLRFWMAYRAYMKPDSETHDAAAATKMLALFEQEFGGKSSAIDEEWINREQSDGDGTF